MNNSQPIVIPFTRLFRIFEKVVDPTGKNRNRKFSSSIEMERIITQLLFYCKNVTPEKCSSLFEPLQRKTEGDPSSNWFRILESISNSQFDKFNKANQMANMCYIPPNFDQIPSDNPQLIQQATGLAFVLDAIYYSMGKSLKDENLKVHQYSEYFKKWFFINFFEQIPMHRQTILLSLDPTVFGLKAKDFPNLGTRPFSMENWNGIINVSHTEQSVDLLKKSNEFKTAQRITEDFAATSDAIEKLQNTIETQRKEAERYEMKLTKCRHEMYKNIVDLENKQAHLKELGCIINDGVLANDQRTLEESAVSENESTCSQSSKYKLARKEIKISSLGLELSESESSSTVSDTVNSTENNCDNVNLDNTKIMTDMLPSTSDTATSTSSETVRVLSMPILPFVESSENTTNETIPNDITSEINSTDVQHDKHHSDLAFGNELLVPDDVIDMSYGEDL